MSKISHKHTYCVCLCKSANDISLGEDMPNSSNERTIMNCAKGVSLITVKNGCDSLIYVAKLKEIKDSNTDCRYNHALLPRVGSLNCLCRYPCHVSLELV